MAQDLVVLTPEKAIVSFRLATIGSRIMAFLLDAALIVVTLLIVSTIAIFVLMGSPGLEGLVAGFLMVLASVGPFAYFILFEAFWNGQTVGKKALSIRACMADGSPITFGAALGRNLLLPADIFPGTGFVGIAAVFANPKSQRLGDLFANTVVLHDRRPEPVFTPAPHIVGLHEYEMAVGELRGMTQDDYVALKRFCDRYYELSREIQHQMVREIWQPMASKLDIHVPANVAPILYAEAVVMRYGRIHGLL